MDYEKKYKQLHTLISDLYPFMSEYCKEKVEGFFPELKEDEDERIIDAIKHGLKCLGWEHINGIRIVDMITWLEKQGETFTKKDVDDAWLKGMCDAKNELDKQGEPSIYNVPSREVILAIWDLGNEWKELTNGCISTEYGTQLDYIQKHWHESEYYLKEKQSEQKVNYTTLAETGNGGINALVTGEVSNSCDYEEKPANKVEPKCEESKTKIFDAPREQIGKEQKSAWSEEDEKMFADACIMLDWYKGNNWWAAQYIKDWLKGLKQRIGG